MTISIEEKVKIYKELARQIEELETYKKAIVAEILQLLPKDRKNVRIAEYNVRRMTRLSIRTSLEEAKRFEAVKLEEVIDKEKIKSLFALGHSVPGVSEFQFIQVSKYTQTT